MTSTLAMFPYLEKAPANESSVVSKLSPPMNSFPSSDMFCRYLFCFFRKTAMTTSCCSVEKDETGEKWQRAMWF